MTFDCPTNLDCLSVDPADLRQWASTLRERHHELRVGHCTAYLLCCYAENLARSLILRAEGFIGSACSLEQKNAALYAKLPKKFQW